MDDFSKKAVVMAIAIVCLTIAIISSFSIGNVVYPIKSILKNDKNENYFSKNLDENTTNAINDEILQTVKRGTSGAVCIEASSRRVLYADGKDEVCYPASTTKVLTALIALERLPLDKIVIVPEIAEGVEGSSIYLKAGDTITVEDLLFGLMLRSGNDAAVTLATEVAGGIDEFASLMNEKAKMLGARNSHFVNHDFVRIVGTKQRKIEVSGEARYIANKNKLLKLFEGANGVKTGFTKKSGRCLVGGAKRGNMQLITVVLNHGDMWNDTVRMLNFGFDNYEMIPLDNALLTNGNNVVKVKVNQTVTPNWQEVKYPLKKDGSEKLVVEFV